MEFMDDANTMERTLIRKARMTHTPINGSIELLPLCNMNCDMCYVRLSPQELAAQGRLRTPEEWIALGREMAEEGTLFLLLTGGEPLMYQGFQEVYLALKEMGLILTINTNATLLDEAWADFFAAHKPRRINITLYGPDAQTYADLCHYPGGFEKCLQAIRLLQERDIDVKIATSLTRTNHARLDEMLDLAETLGLPLHMDPYMTPSTRERALPYNLQARVHPEEAARACYHVFQRTFTKEENRLMDMNELAKINDPNYPRGDGHLSCLAANCSFTINWQGQMRPCVMLTEPSVPVFETGFAAAWQQLIQDSRSMCIHPTCTSCSLKPICRVCPASAYWETGTYDGIPDYLCRYSQEYHRLLQEV